MGAVKQGRKTINRAACTFAISGGTSFSSSTSAGSTSEKLIHRARVVYTANITQSSTNTVDGITVIAGDTVLCTAQTDAKQNGLFYVRSSTWERIPDTLVAGHLVRITAGTSFANTIWGNSNTTDPIIGTDNVTYARKDTPSGTLFASNNLSELTSISTARTNLGLGTLSTQNSNNVSIAGGNVTGLNQLTANGSNSNISIGTSNSASITSKSSGTITLQNSGGSGANLRLLQGAVDGSFPLSSGAAMTFSMTNNSNSSAFLSLIRNRTSGNNSDILNAQVITSSTLSVDDKVSFVKRLQPNSGASAYNYSQMGISDASTSTPSSYEDLFVTQAGSVVRAARFAYRVLQLFRSTFGSWAIQVSDTLANTNTLTLPDAQITTNQVMVSIDNSGTLQNKAFEVFEHVPTGDKTGVNNSIYLVSSTSSRQNISLPSTVNVGDRITIIKRSDAVGWRITQTGNTTTGQRIWDEGGNTTRGTGGYIESNSDNAAICLMNVDGDNDWQVIWSNGYVTKV